MYVLHEHVYLRVLDFGSYCNIIYTV